MSLGPWMRLMVDLFETLNRRMSIHLRGPQRGVSEQFLHGSEVGTGVEQMSRERMAQRVHVQVGSPRQGVEQPLHRELNAAGRKPAAVLIHEDRPRAGKEAIALAHVRPQ